MKADIDVSIPSSSFGGKQNTPPSIELNCPSTIAEDSLVTCTSSFTSENGDLTWRITNGTCPWASINSATGELSGTPRNNHVGTCQVGIRANDGKSDSDEVLLNFTIQNTDTTLSAIANATISQGSALLTLKADSEVDASDEGQALTYSFDHATTTPPKCTDNGLIAIDATTGEITFDVDDSFSGTCYTKVSANDGHGGIATSEFATTITAIANTAPTISSTCTTTLDEDISYSCTPSVSDANWWNTHTWSFTTNHTCSWLTINVSGQISGTPNDNDVGTCVLEFKANDGLVDSNVETYTITVNNVAPSFAPITTANINEDSGLQIIKTDAQVQSIDEGLGVYSLDNSTVSAPKCSDNGAVTIDTSNGEISFNPNANYAGTCNIKVSFDDQNSINNTASLEFAVVVAQINDTPVMGQVCQGSTSSCSGIKVGSITHAQSSLEEFSGLSDISNSTLCFSPNGSGYDIFSETGTAFPRTNYSSHTLAALGDDSNSNITLASNFEYYGSPISSIYLVSNGYLALNAVTGYNINTGDFVGYEMIAPFWRDLNPSGQGEVRYSTTATESIFTFINVPRYGSSNSNNAQITLNHTTGEIIISYGDIQINDGFYAGISKAGTSIVNFDYTTGTPAGNGLALAQDGTFSCDPSATDADGDTLTWSFDASNTCSWMTINPTTGAIGGSPNDNQVGTCNLAYSASDGTASTPVESHTVTISNLQPTLTIADTSISEDAPLTVIRSDADVQANEEGLGLYSLDNSTVTAPACSSNGTVAIDANTGAISYTPAANYTGICNIKVIFDDGNSNANTVSDEFAVTVTNINDAPIIASSCGTTVNQGSLYTCNLDLTDPDSGDTHTWSSLPSSTCVWASLNTTTGVISGTPNDDQVGTCTFDVKTNDGTTDSNTLSITYTVINMQATLAIADAFIYQDTAATVIRTDADVQASDEPSGVYSLVASLTSPDCSTRGTTSIDSSTGAVTYTPATSFVGDCYINVRFDDQNAVNNIVDDEFKVTVMDNVGANVLSIDSAAGDRTYIYSEIVEIDVNFNEIVFVDTSSGTPKIRLETGSVDRFAYYTSGSGTSTLTFQYQVGLGDTSLDLDVHNSFNTIELSGGTILDNFNNVSDLTLPVGATTGSLFNNRNIIIDTTINFAEFSGQPTRVSADIVLNIDVFGSGVVEHRYKVGPASTNDCSVSTDYSTAIDVATNITDSISSYAYGTKLRLCLVGKNSINNWQPFDLATTYEWTRDKYAITDLDFSAIANIPSYYDAAVAPNNNNIIYARNLSNQILYSNDKGVTWRINCVLPQTNLPTKFHISGESDATAYITINGDAYRADYNVGGNCPNITSSLNTISSNYVHSGFSTSNTTSDIFAAVKKGSTSNSGITLYKSIDRGDSWTEIYTDNTVNESSDATLSIDPTNQNIMYMYRYGLTGQNIARVYKSIDGGVTWSDFFYSSGANSVANWPLSILVSPMNSNNLYILFDTNSVESYSPDQGVTWFTRSSELDDSRWNIISDGTANKLFTVGYDTQLRTAANYQDPSSASWSVKYTFLGVRGNKSSSQSVSTSLDGQTYAVIVENKLYVSTDAAATFNEINWQGEKTAILSSISSEDGGQNIYGVTPNWALVKSTNAGEQWNYKDYYFGACGSPQRPRIRVSSASSNNVFVWQDLMGQSGSSCSAVTHSTDGLNTLSNTNNGISTTSPLIAMSPTDPNKFFNFSTNGTQRTTTDGGLTWTSKSTGTYASFINDAFTSSTVSDLVYVIQKTFNGQMFEVNTVTDVRTDITSRTGLTSIAGMHTVKGDGSTFKLRLISEAGQVVESLDEAQTFTNVGTTTGLTSCTKRLLSTYFKDHNIMATACSLGNKVAFTRNSGADWIEMDISALYGIDCGIRGIALHPSKVFIACANTQAIMLNYTPLELINDVVDGVLSSYEGSSTQELIRNVNQNAYVSIEYALIPDGTICNQDITTFSSSIPLANDPAIATDGVYRVCAKMTDENSVVFYEASSSFIVDKTVPQFNSIDLANEASDGILKFEEHYKNINPVVENLNGSGFDIISYALVPSTTTCDNTLTYSQSTPQANDYLFESTGNYKICVKLSDYAGHPDAFGESAVISFTKEYNKAVINNAPDLVTRDNVLNINITGTGVTKYRYLLQEEATANCTIKANYSPEISSGINITDSLTGFAINTKLKLCVLGSNNSDDWQSPYLATEYIFSRGNNTIESFKVANNAYVDFAAVGIAMADTNLLYTLDRWGQAYRSTDFGSNWEVMCKLPLSNGIRAYVPHILVSKANDKTGYIFHRGDIYRIDDLNGHECLNLTSGISSLASREHNPAADIDINGVLYFWENTTLGVTLWKSSTKGNTLNFVASVVNGNASEASLTIDDNNPLIMHSIQGGGSSTDRGIFKSTDGGLTWTKTSSSVTSPYFSLKISPNNSNHIYAQEPYRSLDGGNTWNYSSNFYNQPFALAGDEAIRYNVNNNPMRLEISSGLSTSPSWSTLKTINGTSRYEYGQNIVVVGNKMAFLAGGDLYLSTDLGTTLTKTYLGQEQNPYIWSFDEAFNGEIFYAGVSNFKVIGSRDYGATWTHKANLNPSMSFIDSYLHYQNPSIRIDRNDNNSFYTYFNNAKSNGSPISHIFMTKNDFSYTRWFHINYYQYFESASSIVRSGHTYFTAVPSSAIPKIENSSLTYNTGQHFTVPSGYNTNYSKNQFAVSVINENQIFFSDNNQIFTYKMSHNDLSDITPVIALTDFEGIEAFKRNDGIYGLRLFNKEGYIAESFDNANSWSVVTTTITNPVTCNTARKIQTNSSNSNIITSFCMSSNVSDLHYSFDGGVTFNNLNLGSIGLACNMGSATYHKGNIYVGCSDRPAFVIKLNEKNEFTTIAQDGSLNAADIAANSPILNNNTSPNFTTNTEYAVVNSNVACDNSLVYTSTVPTTGDASFATDGEYKICIKITDLNLNVSYSESQPIIVQNNLPSFTSVALINAASDSIINYNEKLDNYDPIIDIPVGSNYSTVYYLVADSSVTCSTETDYDIQRPSAYHNNLHTTGTYKVCIKLENKNGDVTYGESSPFSYNALDLLAKLSNLPLVNTKDPTYNITVSADSATEYKYKMVTTNYDVCKTDSGYSAATPIATPITGTLPSTGQWKLCVIAGDGTGLFQPLRKATTYSINYTNYDQKKFDFGAISTGSWYKVHVSQHDESVIYAILIDGRVIKSVDTGATWNTMCSVKSSSYEPVFYESAGADQNIYLVTNKAYRIDNSPNSECRDLLTPLSLGFYSIGTSFNGFTVATNGHLYLAHSGKFYKSENFGNDWKFVSYQNFNNAGTILLEADKNDPNTLLFMNYGSGPETGVYKSTDGLKTYSYLSSPPNIYTALFTVPSLPNFIYTCQQHYSTDAGATWLSGTICTNNIQDRTKAGDGFIYQIYSNGDSTYLKKNATPMTTPATYTTFYTFPESSGYSRGKDLSIVGNTVAAVVNYKLHISTDSGVNFSEVIIPSNYQNLTSIDKVNNTFVGTTQNWKFLKSVDSAATWASVDPGHVGRDDLIVRMSPANENYVYATPSTQTNTYDTSYFYSNDGLSTVNKSNHAVYSATARIVISPTNENMVGFLGGNKLSVSNDGGATIATTSPTIATNFTGARNGFFAPNDDNIIYYNEGSHLKELNVSTSNITTITSRTGQSNIYGLGMTNNAGTWESVVLNWYGNMSYSNDNMATFQVTGVTNTTPMSNCNTHIVKIAEDNPDVISVSCFTYNRLYVTTDKGFTWNSYPATDCLNISDHAIYKELGQYKFIVACSGSNAMEITP